MSLHTHDRPGVGTVEHDHATSGEHTHGWGDDPDVTPVFAGEDEAANVAVAAEAAAMDPSELAAFQAWRASQTTA